MLPAYLVLLTPDYHVPFANCFFRERFGESRGNRCFEYLFGRSEPCEICETYTVLKTMAPHHWEWTGPDGHNYDVFDFPFTDADGSILILEMGIDITEQKRAEEALKESENRLRFLSSQLLTAQENERKRISREIHDSLGQSLSAIKFKVEAMTQEMRESPHKKMAESLETVLPIVQASIEESRRIQMDLRPSTLDDLGILATLGWFCREYQKIYSHIRIEKELAIQEDEVSTLLRTVIYRVMQEAMNNIAKHSKADLIHLSLRRIDDRIELIIRDNGMGFDAGEILSPESFKKGLGLDSMRERTELSGGTFVIESSIGKGTTIKAAWPP
jgi:signal transduction histidine kinase